MGRKLQFCVIEKVENGQTVRTYEEALTPSRADHLIELYASYGQHWVKRSFELDTSLTPVTCAELPKIAISAQDDFSEVA